MDTWEESTENAFQTLPTDLHLLLLPSSHLPSPHDMRQLRGSWCLILSKHVFPSKNVSEMSLSSFKTCSCQLPVFAAPPLPAPACCQCALRSAQELYCPQQVLRDFASPVQSCFFHSEENTFKARRQTQITCFCSDPLPSRPAPLPSSYTTYLLSDAQRTHKAG